jgi:hypothetical protein
MIKRRLIRLLEMRLVKWWISGCEPINYAIRLTNCLYLSRIAILNMQTLEIKVPDNKTHLVVTFLKEMGVSVKIKKNTNLPNADTIAAMAELKEGKGKKFKDVNSLFNSI